MTRRGRAIGGPRHNVVLSASDAWTGFIRNHSGNRYVWSQDDKTWVWTPCVIVTVNEFIHSDEQPRKGKSRKKSTESEPII